MKPDGSIPKLKPAMMADAVGTTFGALLERQPPRLTLKVLQVLPRVGVPV